MSHAQNFAPLLLEIDRDVFGTESTACFTSSDIQKLIESKGTVIYMPYIEPLVTAYPDIQTDKVIPAENFYLIHEPLFERCAERHPLRVYIFYEDTAIQAVLEKIMQTKMALYGGFVNFVTMGGLLSAQEIHDFTGVEKELSVAHIKRYIKRAEHQAFKKISRTETYTSNDFDELNAKVNVQVMILQRCLESVALSGGKEKVVEVMRNILNVR